jgi:hypothetical protein
MPRIVSTVVAVWMAAAALPLVGYAQHATSLGHLATPPQSVGSCSPAPAPMQLRADAPVSGFTGRQLVFAVGENAANRTMIAYVDRRGRPRQYAEWTVQRAEGHSRTNAEIEATVDTTGRVRGFLLHHTLPVRGAAQHTRRPLTVPERRTVRALTQWLLTRCPA